MTPHRWLAVAVLVAAALFAVGSGIERNQKGEKAAGHVEAPPLATEGSHGERGSGEHAGESGAERATEQHSESENLLGVNPEATGLVILAVAFSLLLAAAVWLRPLSVVLIAVIVFGVAFAALDVRELVHQVNESRTGIAVIAAVLVALHAGVAAFAAFLLTRAPVARHAN